MLLRCNYMQSKNYLPFIKLMACNSESANHFSSPTFIVIYLLKCSGRYRLTQNNSEVLNMVIARIRSFFHLKLYFHTFYFPVLQLVSYI